MASLAWSPDAIPPTSSGPEAAPVVAATITPTGIVTAEAFGSAALTVGALSQATNAICQHAICEFQIL